RSFGLVPRRGIERRQDAIELALAALQPDEDLAAFDNALSLFAAIEPQKAELVKLRYFAGLTIEEAAQALGISPGDGEAALDVQQGLAAPGAGRVSGKVRKSVSQFPPR